MVNKLFYATASDGVELCYSDETFSGGLALSPRRDEDEGEEELVVFQHGYTSARATWLAVVPLLLAQQTGQQGQGRGRYRAICVDMRGCGFSGKPSVASAYSIARFAEDVLCVVDKAAGKGRSFTYVGHSLGGGIGFALATGAHSAGRLKRMVLVTPMPAQGVVDPFHTHAHDIRRRSEMAVRQYYQWRRAWHARTEWVDAHEEQVTALFVQDLSVPKAYYDAAWDAMLAFRCDPAKITVPTLMVTGDCDTLLASNFKDYRTMAKANGNASLLVVPRASHSLPRDVPEQLAQAIHEFVVHGVVNVAALEKRAAKYDLDFKAKL